MIKFLLEKEFKQILRNSFLPRMIIMMPIMMMLLFPFAANQEIKNIKLSIVDNDHSTYSQRLTAKITSSGYFHLTNVSQSNSQAMRSVELSDADIILEIEPDFEANLIRESKAEIMICANAVNSTKGAMGSSYLGAIVSDFAQEIRPQTTKQTTAVPIITISEQYLFNPELDYKTFMVPAIMVMLLTLLGGFLPALNIVGEKEKGTIEQINVTPVSKFSFIIAKLIPYWIIGLIVLSLAVTIAATIYRLTPVGSLLTIYGFAGLYLLVVSGLGLVISNYSQTMQQAMFVMFFFLIIFILMSGLFTPINSMPNWAQRMASFNPLKYFIEVMRMVYLKGSSIGELHRQLFALCGFALFFNSWAILSYRKSK